MVKFISWNVNGIKSTIDKGLIEFIKKENPDYFCFQETKTHYTDLDKSFQDYYASWNPAGRKGYAGTAIFSKEKPLKVIKGIEYPEFDSEGRVLTLELAEFFLTTTYTVNSQRGLPRLSNRMEWDKKFLEFLKDLDMQKPIIICGDFNVAHKEIDLANPKQNRRNAGFTDEERNGFTKMLDTGFIDTFREFNKNPGKYTWWSSRTNARAKNIGWRLDYFLVSKRLLPKVKKSEILGEILGSDHCPIMLEIK